MNEQSMVRYKSMVRYNGVARTLHWIIAFAIIAEIVIALERDVLRSLFSPIPVHKAIGITVLVLSIARLLWRLTHPVPRLPETMSKVQVGLAHGLHGLFYLMIIGVPLSGWIMSSAGTRPLQWFGLFDIPKLPISPESPLAAAAHSGHETMGLLFIPLIVLHVVAALYHQLVLKDGVLRRML